MYSALIGVLGCFLAPRAVWLACVGRLTFLVRVCLDGFLLWFRIACACPTTASLCNTLPTTRAHHTVSTPNHVQVHRLHRPGRQRNHRVREMQNNPQKHEAGLRCSVAKCLCSAGSQLKCRCNPRLRVCWPLGPRCRRRRGLSGWMCMCFRSGFGTS